MPEIRGGFDKILVVSETATIPLCMRETRTLESFGMMDNLAVLVLFRTTFIDRCIKYIHPAKLKIVSHHSPLVPILTIH